MQQQRLIPLRNPDKRRTNKYIILTQVSNFSRRHNPMVPDLKGFLPYFTYLKLQNYFFENLEKRILPFHYHINYFMGDWIPNVSTPLNVQSDMIEQCIANGYMDSYFRDAIVIAIQDDYSQRVPDLRTYEVMGSKVIAPLMQTLKMGNYRDCVVWFDEIFNYDKYNRDMETNSLDNPYPYEVRRTKFFDRVQFNLETRRFL